jgi:CrcB protein
VRCGARLGPPAQPTRGHFERRIDVSEAAGYREPEALAAMPVDADADAVEDGRRGRSTSPFDHRRRTPWPRLHADVIAVVFVGGCVGGYARYAVDVAWDAPRNGFPVATLAVNLAGAFVLALVVVVATEIRPSRYLRPLLGTGFCGALTTFSAVVVALARQLEQGRYAVAAGYVAATVVGGLAAASLGLIVGRALHANRRRVHDNRSP